MLFPVFCSRFIQIPCSNGYLVGDRTTPIHDRFALWTLVAVAERSKASDFFRSFGQVDLEGRGLQSFFLIYCFFPLLFVFPTFFPVQNYCKIQDHFEDQDSARNTVPLTSLNLDWNSELRSLQAFRYFVSLMVLHNYKTTNICYLIAQIINLFKHKILQKLLCFSVKSTVTIVCKSFLSGIVQRCICTYSDDFFVKSP